MLGYEWLNVNGLLITETIKRDEDFNKIQKRINADFWEKYNEKLNEAKKMMIVYTKNMTSLQHLYDEKGGLNED